MRDPSDAPERITSTKIGVIPECADGAGPESILTIVVMDSGLAVNAAPGMTEEAYCSTSNRPAAPMPPPTHIVTTAYLALRRRPSISAWPVRRAPDMP